MTLLVAGYAPESFIGWLEAHAYRLPPPEMKRSP